MASSSTFLVTPDASPGPSRTVVPVKRRQVKNACTRCQKSSKGCDDSRPCRRCIRYGFGVEECIDSPRKERKKGTKRGPYRKKNAIGIEQGVAPEAMAYTYGSFYAGLPGPQLSSPPRANPTYPDYPPTAGRSYPTPHAMYPMHAPSTVPYDPFVGFVPYGKATPQAHPPPLPGPPPPIIDPVAYRTGAPPRRRMS
ncbi:Zn(2)-C6 fungal-type domain-containing protein [Mycena kentingensis (nom. inval.)]|nr:Zn(2)-C6 fungal-type domain-containing protein [Mycena kentingensis (nom. inval.)]